MLKINFKNKNSYFNISKKKRKKTLEKKIPI